MSVRIWLEEGRTFTGYEEGLTKREASELCLSFKEVVGYAEAGSRLSGAPEYSR